MWNPCNAITMTTVDAEPQHRAGPVEITRIPDKGSQTPTATAAPQERLQQELGAGGVKEREVLSIWKRVYAVLTWTPPNCRWDPNKPPQFSMSMNVLFAFAAGFTVANLYYSEYISIAALQFPFFLA